MAARDPDPELRPFDLGVLMARLHNRLGPQARAKGLTLWIDGQANLLGPLLVDAGRLEQVLAILIDNAIQFTDQGEIRLQLQTLMISPARVRLRFEVRDTGSGLSPDFLTRLLTPDGWDARLAPRDDGTGQGLATSKRLIESMGGTLGAISQPGRGTTFGFELLLSRALTPASDPRSTAPLMPVPGRPLSGMRILVVDDSNITREVIAQALEVAGAQCALATDGQQAIQLLRAKPDAFDALLMDLQMPLMDGLTATRLIRGELGLTQLPIIALTAGVLPRQLEEARQAGITEILAKPVKRDRMAEVLRQWVPEPPLPPAGQPPRLFPVPPAARAPELPLPARDRQSPFPLIAGIDRQRAQEIFCGNRPLFLNFIAEFAASSGDLAGWIRQDLARGRGDDAARRLHKLRGNAGGIGALEVMRIASRLEEALDRGDQELELEPGLGELESQLSILLAAIAQADRGASDPWAGASLGS